jgi:BMFP domain-containing protein YqiC
MSIQQREQFKQLVARVAELEKKVSQLEAAPLPMERRKPGPKPRAEIAAGARAN